MRPLSTLLCLTLAVAGCTRRATVVDYGDVQPAKNASILGEWVLANPEKTHFVGTSRVVLTLQPGEFRLVAEYPGASPVVVDGDAFFDPNGGRLTLTPRSSTRATAEGRSAPLFEVGKPLVMLATAADNTMVFAEPGDRVHMPTSVWHRSTVAVRPGDAQMSQVDSIPR